jgi:hypothetical protein
MGYQLLRASAGIAKLRIGPEEMDCCRTGAHGDVLVARVGWLGERSRGVPHRKGGGTTPV